jgi:tetratricopeptide (TPR) repeat protein
VTQNNLGNALQAQATRAKPPENLRLLDEAVTAYRQALLVFTREQRPQMWAMTKHNLGSALQEKATRSQGPDANRLFEEAVSAYQEALLIWTREQRPQQWAMAQNNLARAYFNLNEWTFTTGSIAESERRISSLLSDVRVEATIKIPLLAIEIANLIALKRSTEVPAQLKNLVELLKAQPAGFKLQRSFTGTERFVSQSQQLAEKKDWLLRLFGAMAGENRDAIIKEVKVASENFSQK